MARRLGVTERVLGHHHLLERLLGVRPDPERALGVVDRVGVAAGDQQLPRSEQVHPGGAVAVELALAVDPGVVGKVLEQVAAIGERRGLGEEVQPVGRRGLGTDEQPVEDVDVGGDLIQREPIGAGVGGQHPPRRLTVGEETLAQLGDVGLERAPDVLGDTAVGPEVGGELVLGDRTPARQQQGSQEFLRLQSAEVLVLQ